MAKLLLIFLSGYVFASGTFKLPVKINEDEIQRRLAILCKKRPEKIICKKLKKAPEKEEQKADK